MSASTRASARPAQLAFLAIYNPSLGTTDETLDQQIVYYYTGDAAHRGRKNRQERRDGKSVVSKEEMNRRLRQIGLAQGMVEFGRSFSDGEAVDTVDTEKSRIVIYELEVGWWVLASIDLSQIPLASPPKALSKGDADKGEPKVEYSSREVKPPALLLQDLVRAHITFLLHHASSLSELFVRTKRSKFMSIMYRYWDTFVATWSVMLRGNPAVDIYGGIKLAACGELGIGVGEEDRGSGEREVLEGFVGRIDGLVDIIVSRFGDPLQDESQEADGPPQSWLGNGITPTPEDGAIFLGTGAVSRKSLRALTHWMEDIYTFGSLAYGVKLNPNSTRRARLRRTKQTAEAQQSPKEPPTERSQEIITTDQSSSSTTQANRRSSTTSRGDSQEPRGRKGLLKRHSATQSTSRGGRLTSILKLGYGTHWSLGGGGSSSASVDRVSEDERKKISSSSADSVPASAPEPEPEPFEASSVTEPRAESPSPERPNMKRNPSAASSFDDAGRFLIGMMGDMEERVNISSGASSAEDYFDDPDSNARIPIRTVIVELERESDTRAEADMSIELGSADTRKMEANDGTDRAASHALYESQDRNKTKKLRVVVYVSRPFMFTFLFEVGTDSLALEGLYRSIHYQLAPLQRPLLLSTQYKLTKHVLDAAVVQTNKAPIYDLIWDPKNLTVYSTIPNIPDPFQPSNQGDELPAWSRLEALNTHTQIINTWTSTRTSMTDFERTCKTSRGWWVVWTRIPENDMVPPSPQPRRIVSSTPQARGQAQLKKEESEESQVSEGTSKNGRRTATTGTSLVSGPAHPFIEGSGILDEAPKGKEVILIRRSSEHPAAAASSRFGSSILGDSGWGADAARLAQGIGVDTKRYIEGLLDLI